MSNKRHCRNRYHRGDGQRTGNVGDGVVACVKGSACSCARNNQVRAPCYACLPGRTGAHQTHRPDRLAILVDVYHHDDNREAYFRGLQQSLKAGGRLAIIDFTMDSPVGPPRSGRIASEKVKAEIARAGYVLTEEHTFLPHQYFLIFKPATR